MNLFEDIRQSITKKQQILKIKNKILDRFMQKDLSKICKDYGLKEPSKIRTNSLTGEVYQKEVSRNDYIKLIITELSTDQIKRFCTKNRIDIKEL